MKAGYERKNTDGVTAISNRIFEVRIYNLFLSEELLNNPSYDAASIDKNQFIADGQM